MRVKQLAKLAIIKLCKDEQRIRDIIFLKSQVVAMHAAGADLPTIAKQTGYKSLKTLDQHYL